MRSIENYDPGIEVSQALELLDSVRDEYAEAAFEDWAQTYHDPNTPGSEMKEVIEYYKVNGSTAPFDMDEYDTVLQRLDEFDAAHQPAFSAPRNAGTGPTWNAAKEVESMMQTLRMPSE
ncbi:hypothetical protein GCM10023084_83030 [Streptomyces lacrimifluminis]|uniref:Uncharacterized protein n=1 Tax=Streptomyces lacrimifluminis TaxID=1500077 RepID=A0A917PE35_9ACTN|nr:hypothetical protein [Streptomyces lacrimifluminis]GGJ72582.1 hypothetical protein GCM10012282_81760 [Streptomyces lacrimifluminis]